jgi:hypothetical protein
MAQADAHIAPATAPLDAGDRFLIRLFAVFAGMGLILSAAGIWVLASDAFSIWVKMAISLVFLVLGAIALAPRSARKPLGQAPLEIEIDAEARVLRIVEQGRDGEREVGACYGFDRLGRMDLRAHSFTACDREGRLLLRIPLHSRAEERRLFEAVRAVQA